jgi:propionate CoA-transferase
MRPGVPAARRSEGEDRMPEVIDAAAAAGLIRDGDSVLFGGSGGGHGVAEAVIEALAARFRESASPRGLTLTSIVSLGDWEGTGFNLLADPGLAKRVVSAGFNNCPKIAELALADAIEAYTLPQGALSQLCRDMAAGRPGLLTPIGLDTFVDPRHGGGKQSRRATEDLVELVTLGGQDYLFYRCLPIDVAVIRGTTADRRGNVTMEEEAYSGENFSIAAATRRQGGIVVCQVKQIAETGLCNGKEVKVPGALIDYLVVAPDQRQTYQTAFDPAYTGAARRSDTELPVLPFDIRKVMARRGAMELFPGALVNLGFGVSNGIAAIAAEEGFYDQLTLTVEQGIIGGVPAGGKDAGAGVNFDMMVDQPYQFDFYDGGGLDVAFLSFAQVDAEGNVNVSRYGRAINGPGGFINISQGTGKVVFSGTLTTGGLQVAPDGDGRLMLEHEGRVQKWLPRVEQVTFSGRHALERGQQVMYITDRAVFQLTAEGIELVEIAPGIDLERDLRDRIGFPIRVSDALKPMDVRLFRDRPMNLLPEFRARGRDSAGKKTRRRQLHGRPAG